MYDDALRGYAFAIHKRDGFKCVYWGLDGKESFPNWLSLSQDHLLPKGHPDKEKQDFIVTACQFCNTADNHYFERESSKGNLFVDQTPEKLIQKRKVGIELSRSRYLQFYKKNVLS